MLPTNGRENRNAANMVEESKSKTDRNIRWLEKKKDDMIEYFIKK